jgi:hypothetical protein
MARKHPVPGITLPCPCGGFVRVDVNAVVGQSHGSECLLAPMPDYAWLAVPEKRRSVPHGGDR